MVPSKTLAWTTIAARDRFSSYQRSNGLYRQTQSSSSSTLLRASRSSWLDAFAPSSPSTNTNNNKNDLQSIETYKMNILQVGAALDRGQSYNPTSGEYYADRMQAAVQLIQDFLNKHPNKIPTSLAPLRGEWELVLSTVPHGIFRSSPFFLAIQEAFDEYAETKTSFGMNKADLFFKLHELQTCSWGISKIGRVAQHITVNNNSDNARRGKLYSEFDTSIFSLTVIPILGWFKLLPTFGGCVVTAASVELGEKGQLNMVVDYTTARKVPGLSGLGKWIWDIKVPVGAVWKLLPWNKGRDASCKLFVRYIDDDFRIVQDVSGDYFVYCRPFMPRELDLAQENNSDS